MSQGQIIEPDNIAYTPSPERLGIADAETLRNSVEFTPERQPGQSDFAADNEAQRRLEDESRRDANERSLQADVDGAGSAIVNIRIQYLRERGQPSSQPPTHNNSRPYWSN